MNTIKTLRERDGYTQEELGAKIGVTKQTIISYEKGTAIPSDKVSAIAKLFEVDCDCIINNTEPKTYTYNPIKTGGFKPPMSEYVERIDVPQNNIEKFKEVFLYIIGKIGALPHVGQTVLYKNLYFIDFDFYEKYETQFIGAKYIKNHFGPTPVDFSKITKEMERNGDLSIVKDKYFDKEQTKYLPRRPANLDMLSAKELSHIDNCLRKYSSMNAKELSDYSHKDVPWIIAEKGEPIEYEAVFYRTPETTVRKD